MIIFKKFSEIFLFKIYNISSFQIRIYFKYYFKYYIARKIVGKIIKQIWIYFKSDWYLMIIYKNDPMI